MPWDDDEREPEWVNGPWAIFWFLVWVAGLGVFIRVVWELAAG